MTDRAGSRVDRTIALKSHIPALDGLRGLAILFVLLHHLTYYSGFRPANAVEQAFYLVTMAGWCGVDLFFVLSGFLITGILCDAKGSERFFRNFYIRRCLRIFPLYFGVLAVFFLVLPLLIRQSAPASYSDALADQAWYWTYLVNVQIAIEGWPRFNLLAHFWSLAVEEQFYLVWPVLVFALSRGGLAKACIGCLFLAFGLRVALVVSDQHLAAYVLAPARMDALALGGLLAVLARSGDGLLRWRYRAWWAAGGAGSAVGALFVAKGGLWTEDAVTSTVGYSLLAVFFGALLTVAVTASHEGFVNRVLCSRWLRALGCYSYGLYVFHHPILIGLRKVFTASDLPTVFGSHLPGLATYALVGAGASIVVAVISWHLYETPFLKLKERFSSAPAVRPVAAVSQV